MLDCFPYVHFFLPGRSLTGFPSEFLFIIFHFLSQAHSQPRVRNRRELNASLTGTTLGDPDGEAEDALKWIKRAKKREKELARKRQLELENMDKIFQGDEYTESTYPTFHTPLFLFLMVCFRGS